MLHGAGARYAQSEKYADYLAAHSGAGTESGESEALEYMAAIIRTVAPLLTKEQSQKKLQKMLIAGKGKHYYAETEGAVRYVVADNGEKGLTFAVEPIKLALSENLEGAN